MGLIDRLNSWIRTGSIPPPAIQPDAWNALLTFNGHQYPLSGISQTIQGSVEEIGTGFDQLIVQAFQSNAVVFACELARIQLFSEARFQFQELRKGRPGALFSSPALDVLEHPWPTAITGDMLTRALIDADFGGTAFNARRSRTTIRRLRPDWVTMILGSFNDPSVTGVDIDADLLGVAYYPGGKITGKPPEFLLREEISVFAPIPDPLAAYRGMPWVLPVLREIMADKQMTDHKSAYLVNGATPNLTVAIDKDLKESANPAAFMEWVEAFKKTNVSASQWDKYKTWYLAGGTVVTKVGDNLGSDGVDFKSVQGAGETRIAAAAGVPPVIVGLSEGLQAATYSNYGQARRRFADNTMRPLWRNMAGSLENLVPPPAGSRLWYDDRDIQALAEDKKDLAEVHALEAQQMRTLVDAGFKPDAVIEFIKTGDSDRLMGQHSGLYSVQLQPPQPDGPPKPEPTALVPVPPPGRSAEELVANAMTRVYQDLYHREQAPPQVHVYTPEQTTIVNVPEQVSLPPIVNVEAAQISVEPTPVTVTVEPAEITVMAPDVTVEPPQVTINVPAPRAITKTVERDDKGQITAIVETPDGDES